jgi:hypothetical protein
MILGSTAFKKKEIELMDLRNGKPIDKVIIVFVTLLVTAGMSLAKTVTAGPANQPTLKLANIFSSSSSFFEARADWPNDMGNRICSLDSHYFIAITATSSPSRVSFV